MADVFQIEVNGIPVLWDNGATNDIEFLEAMADLTDGNPMKVVTLMRMAFGVEQYENIKSELARDGHTKASDVSQFFWDAMEKAAEAKRNEAKN